MTEYNKEYYKEYYKKNKKSYDEYHRQYFKKHKEKIYQLQRIEHREFRLYIDSLSDEQFLEVIGFKDPKEQLKLPKIFKDDDEE